METFGMAWLIMWCALVGVPMSVYLIGASKWHNFLFKLYSRKRALSKIGTLGLRVVDSIYDDR